MESKKHQKKVKIAGSYLMNICTTLAVFVLEDALSVWMNLDKHLLFIWFFACSIKMPGHKTHYASGQTILHCFVLNDEQQKIVHPDG